MFKLLIISLLFNFSFGNIIPETQKCCVDHPKKRKNDLVKVNYNCEHLTNFGSSRCNQVLGGNVCKWDICPTLKKCQRLPHHEQHFNKNIDVGKCSGGCKDDFNKSCSPSEYEYLELKNKKVKVISDCECLVCAVKEKYGLVKIPLGSCVGDCQTRNNSCMAGVDDKYSPNNGIEFTNPSLNLLNSAAGICSLGVQTGFDTFIDNRCFVHTFEECIRKDKCPIRKLLLDICMEAAQVSLTQTDSIRLGTNGNGLWGMGLPALNGGSWNQGDNICLTLDLDNLGIQNSVIMDGNLDVLVQDDTAVDFLRLNVEYEDCEVCLPTEHRIHTIYGHNGLQHYRHIKDCDCLNMMECHREILEETYYPGTNFEVTLDIGQCLGKCKNGNYCNREISQQQIKTPYGNQNIDIIKGCFC